MVLSLSVSIADFWSAVNMVSRGAGPACHPPFLGPSGVCSVAPVRVGLCPTVEGRRRPSGCPTAWGVVRD
jgi:hypothetical protein